VLAAREPEGKLGFAIPTPAKRGHLQLRRRRAQLPALLRPFRVRHPV